MQLFLPHQHFVVAAVFSFFLVGAQWSMSTQKVLASNNPGDQERFGNHLSTNQQQQQKTPTKKKWRETTKTKPLKQVNCSILSLFHDHMQHSRGAGVLNHSKPDVTHMRNAQARKWDRLASAPSLTLCELHDLDNLGASQLPCKWFVHYFTDRTRLLGLLWQLNEMINMQGLQVYREQSVLWKYSSVVLATRYTRLPCLPASLLLYSRRPWPLRRPDSNLLVFFRLGLGWPIWEGTALRVKTKGQSNILLWSDDP